MWKIFYSSCESKEKKKKRKHFKKRLLNKLISTLYLFQPQLIDRYGMFSGNLLRKFRVQPYYDLGMLFKNIAID